MSPGQEGGWYPPSAPGAWCLSVGAACLWLGSKLASCQQGALAAGQQLLAVGRVCGRCS